jgi:uncharacterized membrane protein YeaQ/YmgE (transglycosylase-associated protein family)
MRAVVIEDRRIMEVVLWLIFGALAGWIASKIMNTDAEQGMLANILVGVIGAVIGGYLFNAFGEAKVTGFNFYSLLVAVVGAVVLLAIVKMVRR